MTSKQTDSRSHRDIADLLPWYVNETLSPAEREAVAAHLDGCPDCLAEAEMLRAVGSAVQKSNARLPFPSDDGLNALLSRVERAGAARDVRGPVARLKGWWAPLPAFAKWALAAQALAVIALACASAVLLQRANLMESAAVSERQRAEELQARAGAPTPMPTQGGPETGHQSFSGPQTKVPCSGVQVTVIFREDATERKIRELLTDVDATVIDGPTAARFYELCVAVPRGSEARKHADEILARLRRRADVVRLAEPAP